MIPPLAGLSKLKRQASSERHDLLAVNTWQRTLGYARATGRNFRTAPGL
jgi:hypothetical protein